MKKDLRGHIIELSKKIIPHNANGDPAFKSLGGSPFDTRISNPDEHAPYPIDCLLGQFSCEEIIEMVNRYLYQAEYQRNTHRNRQRDEAERLRPLREKIEQMFGVRWTKATPTQIEMATKKLAEERGE